MSEPTQYVGDYIRSNDAPVFADVGDIKAPAFEDVLPCYSAADESVSIIVNNVEVWKLRPRPEESHVAFTHRVNDQIALARAVFNRLSLIRS